jgi:predicted nucleic acid-binding protein
MRLVYLDTNVYSRPFDDQMQADIQAEANAFIEIMVEVKAGHLTLLCSDILEFEVNNILSAEKCAKVREYLSLCAGHIDNAEELLLLGKRIQSNCSVRARDALHVASAIAGGAQYFLSCDKHVIRVRQRECYRRIIKVYR